jgi:cytochrome c oxidase subunit 3
VTETAPAEPAHAGHHTSIWPFLVAMAAGLAFAGVVVHVALVAVGVGLLIYAVGGWLVQDRAVKFGVVEGPIEDFPFKGVSMRKLGMWLFLGSEIFFFTGLIGTAFALRLRTEAGLAALTPWPAGVEMTYWAAPGEILNVPLTAVNTFILIASSFTMVEALRAAERGNQRGIRFFLLATLLLGITFVSIQAYEYQKLFLDEGLRPWGIDPDIYAENHPGFAPPLWGPTYGTAFYVQTGFHGAHVSGGVLGLAFLTGKAFKGGYSAKNHEAIELVGLYWHFVDVVWIFLFTVVYLV